MSEPPDVDPSTVPPWKRLFVGTAGIVVIVLFSGIAICGCSGVVVIAALNELGKDLDRQFEAISEEVGNTPTPAPEPTD